MRETEAGRVHCARLVLLSPEVETGGTRSVSEGGRLSVVIVLFSCVIAFVCFQVVTYGHTGVAFNPGTQGAEVVESLWVLDRRGLQSEFQPACQGYIVRASQRKKSSQLALVSWLSDTHRKRIVIGYDERRRLGPFVHFYSYM